MLGNGGVTSTDVGGLVGWSDGTISMSYASGAVSGSNYVGGLAGTTFNGHTQDTYAVGAVSGSNFVGGLVGVETGGTITGSYWDKQSSGTTTGVGLGNSSTVTGLTTAQMMTSADLGAFTFGTTGGASGWVIVDANGTLNNASGAAGGTYPILLSEYSTTITNGHQLQLMALNYHASYTLANDIDMSGTRGGDVWSSAGFVPFYLVGSLNGDGYAISNLYENNPSNFSGSGLFVQIKSGATVEDLVIEGASIAGENYVGALAGSNLGTI